MAYRKRRRSSHPKISSHPFDELGKELEELLSTSSTNVEATRSFSLTYLPTDVLLRIFSFHRSRDICVFTVVCRDLSPLCKSRELWSNLYVRRWPVYTMAQELSGAEWREKYRNKHETEMRRLSKGCPPELLHYFVQMKQAKNHSKKRNLNEFTIIEEWFDKHPTARQVSRLQRENHFCSSQTCKYYHVSDLYICEQTGKTHFCGSTCNSQQECGDLLMCIVSRRIFESEILPQESGVKIGIAIGMESSENIDEDDEEEDDGASFLAKCYSYGYSCNSEVEYQNVLDVVLPR